MKKASEEPRAAEGYAEEPLNMPKAQGGEKRNA